jgi:hypothetical protein
MLRLTAEQILTSEEGFFKVHFLTTVLGLHSEQILTTVEGFYKVHFLTIN